MELKDEWIDRFGCMQREMERLLSHLGASKPPPVRFGGRAWEPAIDVFETEDDVVVLAELAGVNQDDICLEAERTRLVIRGERRESIVQRHRVYHKLAINVGPFEGCVSLPVAVDPERAQATFKDGLLEVTLPKALVERNRQVNIT